MKSALNVAVGLFILVVHIQTVAAQTVNLPAPTGAFGVGRRIVRWIDASRTETLSARSNEKREVVIWLWYPAATTPDSKPAPYVDQLDQLSKGLPGEAVSLARSAQSYAVSNAAVAAATQKFPVILFSPGSGTIPALYTSLCEELASHGYVVAAVDHPYDDLAVLLSDGRVVNQAEWPSDGEERLRFERERVTVRTQDLRFALDQLALVAGGRIADSLQGKLDLSQIGAFGHSVGGMTAAELCRQDPRVLACANMDGVVNAMPAYDDDSAPRLDRPFLFLEKPFRAIEGERPEDAQRRLAFLREKGDALLSNVRKGSSYRVTITGATHETFSDEEILTSENGKRQSELLILARGYVLAFFDKSIKSAASTILDSRPSDAAVRIQVFAPK
jgi:predicted dienelactone hydrolase